MLTQYLPRIEELVSTRLAGVAVDDLLDAAVAALTAHHWQRGKVSRNRFAIDLSTASPIA